MNIQTVSPILEDILIAHASCLEAGKKALLHAKKAGELLVKAKKNLLHGEWGTWVEQNLPFSIRTAQLYMKISKEWNKITSNTQSVALLSMSDAVEIISRPRLSALEKALSELGEDVFLYSDGPEGALKAIEPSKEYPGFFYVTTLDSSISIAGTNHRPVKALGVEHLLSRSGFSFDKQQWEKLPYSGKPRFHDIFMGVIYPCKSRLPGNNLCRNCDATWQVKTCKLIQGQKA